MNEDVVKEVLLKHLELKGKQPRRRPRQSSGPDVLVEGAAIEVKGGKIVERALLDQLAIYLHDYTFVELAIPSQSFSFSLLHKLRALELLSRRGGLERTLRLYLVSSLTTAQFAIVEMDSVLQLSIKADQILYELAKGHTEDEAPAKAAIAFNVEDEVREGLETLVKGEGRCVIVGSGAII